VVDRTSRIARFIKVNTRKSDIVSAVIIEQLRALNRPVHSLTSDNGKEFSQYQTMAKELGTDFYFAHPYSSWERGTNENTNGLLRRFFPKGTDFDKVTQEEIDWVVDKLNNRPRKCFRIQNTLMRCSGKLKLLHLRLECILQMVEGWHSILSAIAFCENPSFNNA
jgi:IS30 family transposase